MTITKQVLGQHVVLFLCSFNGQVITEYLNLLYNSAAIAEPRETETPCTKIICVQENLIQKLAEWKAGIEYHSIDRPHGKHFKQERAAIFARLTNKYREEVIKWFNDLPIEPSPPKENILPYYYSMGYFEIDLDLVKLSNHQINNYT